MCVRRFLTLNGEVWLQISWEEWLLRLLFLSYSLFLAGFFYVPNAVDLYKFYSIAVLVPGLFLIPRAWCLLHRNALFLLVIGYLGYMMLTPAWGDDFAWQAYLKYLRLALYVVVFIVITVVLRQRWPKHFAYLLRFISLLVAVAALVSIVLWYMDPKAGYRLVGIGILENPNASGYAYAVFAVMNLAYSFDRTPRAYIRVLHALAFMSLLVFVLLTYSRGALLALVTACLVIFSGRRPRNSLIAILGLGVAILFVHRYFPEVDAALNRGIGYRPEIWRLMLSRVSEAPIWGGGYLSNQYVLLDARTNLYVFAHNAYLATLRDGGIVGGGLMFAMLSMAAYRAWLIGRCHADYRYLALLVLALACMFLDTDRLLTRPRELWLILWLPLALIISEHMASKRGGS
ncbi:MAG TPA: O-antigen ligase domain-containing protein [Gammaproteobacteria bacterium]|nr:O-antigen ligase domain-containing protein [Gammaproteobacteria bacterium]